MLLDMFLLADAVSGPPDGKLYIHGGGLSRVNAPTLPFTLPQLAFAIRLRIDEAELRQPHQFELSVTDPDGAFVIPPAQLLTAAQGDVKPGPEGEERFLQLSLTLGSLTFTRAGAYRITFRADDELMREMFLPVVALTEDELRAATTAPAPQAPAPNRAARSEAQRRSN